MKNESGIYPVGRHILVKPDEVEEVTEGGIVLPEQHLDKYNQAISTGVVVAVGADSFRHGTEDIYRLVDGEMKLVERRVDGYDRPFAEPGDRIIFAKFAGKGMPGADGEQYRMMNDEDITALADPEVNFNQLIPRENKLGRRYE